MCRTTNKLRIFKILSYQVSYALGHSLATCSSDRVEFINNTCDNRQINNKLYFGHNPFSLKSILGAGLLLEVPGGVNISQGWSFQTRGPASLFMPALGGVTGANQMFKTDLNGDGGAGSTPRADLLPGLRRGTWGRGVSNIRELNRLLTDYNSNVAGHPTPNGQALIDAGIFTAAQLKALKAVTPTIPLVPENNPDPFGSNPVNLDVRVTRPIKIENAYVVHNLVIEPYVDIFNVLNFRGHGPYSGIGAGFLSLNFDYASSTNPDQNLAALKNARAFAFGPRIIQLGFRVSF